MRRLSRSRPRRARSHRRTALDRGGGREARDRRQRREGRGDRRARRRGRSAGGRSARGARRGRAAGRREAASSSSRASAATDALTGAAVAPLPADREDVVVNNRVRGAVHGRARGAAARLAERRAARRGEGARRRRRRDAAAARPEGAREGDRPEIKPTLELAVATLQLKGGDRERAPRCHAHAPPVGESERQDAAAIAARANKDAATRARRGRPARGADEPRRGRGAARVAASAPASRSPACRSARSCCSPRSASRSPTA